MARAARLALLLLAVGALAMGIAGGLVRLGLAVPLRSAAALHGALMVSGFLGTVISLERAMAVGSRLALAAPLASGAGAIALLAGWGLARFAAVALLAGYAWLAAGGIAWAFAAAMRDLALHAFYAPLLLLHATLLWRVAAGAGDAEFRLLGGMLNSAAIGLFAATLAWASRDARRLRLHDPQHEVKA